MFCVVAIVVVALIGCGDDDSATIDAAATDAAASLDGPSHDAASSSDASDLADAVAPVDADGDAAICGTIGDPCTSPMTCMEGQTCVFGGGGNFCSVDRPGCGGIAGATCDDPSAPICMYVTGGSNGVCVSAKERACICAKSAGAIATACD